MIVVLWPSDPHQGVLITTDMSWPQISMNAEAMFSGRIEIWRGYLQMVPKFAASGAGLLQVTSCGESPHNFLLANLIYFGVGGFISLLALLLQLFAAMAKCMHKSGDIWAPVFGVLIAFVLIHGQTEYVLTYPLYFSNSFFWLLAGLVAFSTFNSPVPTLANWEQVQ